MDPADKELLILRRPELVENIDITNGLLTHLLSRKVLNQRMVQSITYNKPPDRQVEDLLDLLSKRGASAFKLFCEALIATDQEDVVTNFLQKKVDIETSSSSTPSLAASSIPASPLPAVEHAEIPVPISTQGSSTALTPVAVASPVLPGSSLSLPVPDPSLTTPLQTVPLESPHKRKPVKISWEAFENEDKSHLASHSETDSSPMKRIRPDPGSVIRIGSDNEKVIKIYNPKEKEDVFRERNVFQGNAFQESVAIPSLVAQNLVPGQKTEETRHVLKHFIVNDNAEDRRQEAHMRMAASLFADLPNEYLRLVSRAHPSPSKLRREEEFSSEIMRERLSRCDSTDTMEARKSESITLDLSRKPEVDQPDQSAVGVQNVVTVLHQVPPVMKSAEPSDGPFNVHVEDCSRQFYNSNKDKAYRMTGIPRGQALIINVNEVSEKPPRRGTDIDRDNLANLLTQLHFEVTTYNDSDDLTALGMAEKLRAFASKPEHANSDACIICLLSHGEEGYMFGTDGKKIPLDEVFLLFDNRHCPALLNKPKVFFIQACRGGMLDQGVKVKLDEPDGGPPGSNNNIQQHPSMSDMLICYPTLQGYYAWRNREKGSWYIEAVVKTFMKYARCEDVCAMLNRVNSDVSRKVSRTPQMEMDRMSQMSEFKSSLRKPYLFFFPGIGAPCV